MAAGTIREILHADTFMGMITAIMAGVPADMLLPGMLTPTQSVEGNLGKYTKVEGTRQTARLAQYGSPSTKRSLQGLSEVPVTLIHAFENETHSPTTLMNLQAEDSPARQQMGKQTIARQTKTFFTRFMNLRISAVYSLLAKGAIYFDSDGNLLPTSSGAQTTVDFRVPAANKGECEMDTGSGILGTDWKANGTDIIGQIKNLKAAALRTTGYPLVHAFYGSEIAEYLMSNTAISSLVAGSASMSEQAALGADIPNGLLGLQWHSVGEAFYVDNDGSTQTWFGVNDITFTPALSPDWYELIEGTYPVPRDLTISNDAVAALANIVETQGQFGYAELTTDPVGIKQYGGDTFLPLLKVPAAICVATVPIV